MILLFLQVVPEVMADTSSIELAGVAGGTVSVSAVIFMLLQRLKDYFPRIEGRWALGALDTISLLCALAVVQQTTPDWSDFLTWLSVLMLTGTFGIVARGIFAQLFHVRQAGVPAGPNAVAVTVVDDGEQPARVLSEQEAAGATETAAVGLPTTAARRAPRRTLPIASKGKKGKAAV
jgi:hypothetical protein